MKNGVDVDVDVIFKSLEQVRTHVVNMMNHEFVSSTIKIEEALAPQIETLFKSIRGVYVYNESVNFHINPGEMVITIDWSK